MLTVDDLRAFAVARSLFEPTTLKRALHRIGFVQADPIRAPARAQDLILRHRVRDYRAGDLERRYSTLGIEEDFFINYGFLPADVWALMHPRANRPRWSGRGATATARSVLDFVRARGVVHPREVDDHFSRGTVTNYWGGSSSATTHLLNRMHYRGLLRVVGRERGIRIYAAHDHPVRAADAASRRLHVDRLVDVIVKTYAPLPAVGLSSLVHRLRYAVPQWRGEVKRALERATARLSHARVNGSEWYWPSDESVPQRAGEGPPAIVRLLAPFDPVVWDRRRFELFWGWAYRFEAYTPLRRRKLGYYAMPLLWRDRVIGWGNLSVRNGRLEADVGYVESRSPRDRGFARELEAELDRISVFLGRSPGSSTE
jgi:uncharacterized protein YcaQ